MIIFFLPNLRGGGAERVMLNLLLSYNSLHPKKQIILLLFKKEGELLIDVPSEIPIWELNTSGATKSVVPFIFLCKKQQPKIVFSSLGCSLTTSLAKPFLSKKIIIINRIGNTIGAEKLLFKNKLKQNLYVLANKIIAKMSDHVVFQCNYMKDDYIRETKIKIKNYSVIYNPVLTDVIDLKSKKKTLKKHNFIAVGRLSPQKDYATLIESCSILKAKGIKFNLLILGEGSLRKKLENNIKNLGLEKHVFLLGHVANPYPYFIQADYLVSSSIYEGFSNVIIEALCLGVPVIVTNCPGGNAEIITSGKNGFLCKVGDPFDLANTLIKGIESKNIFNKAEIRENALRKFSVEIIFNKYLRLLKKHYK
tara:strand:+ start:191 stop:1285 length:1095 start_codon:yes stop_codon:yes gene_type:complete